jgi:multicomponent K+:H+ antiporter subunit D
MGSAAVTSAALFYMLSATLAVSALFLIAELIERVGTTGRAPHLAHVELDEDTNLDDDEAPVVGRLFPVSLALLGVAFMICSLLVAGLPPLSGFLAKVALLRFALMDDAGDFSRTFVPWVFMALLLASSLAATITLARVGMRQFWSRDAHAAPRVKVAEAVSVSMLLLCTLALSVDAERVLGYTRAAAASLHAPQAYVGAVLTTQPRPGPTRPSVLGENAP